MFSSMTMASSTTKPTDSDKAIKERLFKLKPKMRMAANVPIIEIGSARLGMTVAERLPRKRKMTQTTSPMVSSNVNCTSSTELRIETDWSYNTVSLTESGNNIWNCGKSILMLSTTW